MPTTPELEELKEGGFWKLAQHDLMRSEKTKLKHMEDVGKAQERTWIFGRAEALGLKVMEPQSYDLMQKQLRTARWTARALQGTPKRVSLRTPLDITSAIRGSPRRYSTPNAVAKAFINLSPRPKKRQRNHSQRSSKTMRALRHVKGVKVFSFPDRVWKVRR